MTTTMTIRRASERGHADHGWLDSHHTFSFADYHDPAHMGFRALRVINDDVIAGGRGFPPHSHRDMEIITYVLEGALEHKDSLGTGSVVRPGEVQRMSAGTGVTHSEYNHSKRDRLRLLQIWLLPERRGQPPSYQQAEFSTDERRGRLRKVGSRDGADGSVTIHQDVNLYASLLDPGQEVRHSLAAGRHAWIQIARGAAQIGDQPVEQGDGIALTGTQEIVVCGRDAADGAIAELLLFDLA